VFLRACVSVGCTYGYSRCCPSGSGNVSLRQATVALILKPMSGILNLMQ
jgi:hypothetical protein